MVKTQKEKIEELNEQERQNHRRRIEQLRKSGVLPDVKPMSEEEVGHCCSHPPGVCEHPSHYDGDEDV